MQINIKKTGGLESCLERGDNADLPLIYYACFTISKAQTLSRRCLTSTQKNVIIIRSFIICCVLQLIKHSCNIGLKQVRMQRVEGTQSS